MEKSLAGGREANRLTARRAEEARGTEEGWCGACTLIPALTSSLQTLKTLRQVEAINFGDCLVRSKGAIAIADAVRGGLPKLKVPSGVGASPHWMAGWMYGGG